MTDDETGLETADAHRRILKVRLPQHQVIRLHELRIIQGTSIAELLEGILDEYLAKLDAKNTPIQGGASGASSSAPG